jgi:hypothetical protein
MIVAEYRQFSGRLLPILIGIGSMEFEMGPDNDLRRRAIFAVPHMAVTARRRGADYVVPGIGAVSSWVVSTACGKEKSTTLVTWSRAAVRCPDCRAADASQARSDGPA